MAAPEAALAHYRQQQLIIAATLATARRAWAKLENATTFDQGWKNVGPQLLLLLTAAQKASAQESVAYSTAVVSELGLFSEPVGTVSIPAFVGVASDGRNLASLLYEPLIQTFQSLGTGAPVQTAMSTGQIALERIVSTQVADAGRAAESVDLVSRPQISGYVRMLNLPSCDRCAVLAGVFYAWNKGFERHPQCDCTHIPAIESLADSLTTNPRLAIASGQVHGLSKADTKAIVEDGANPAQVINAKRSMSTEQVFGHTVKTSKVGMTRRGALAKSLGKGAVRLRPESIYQIASDRDDAIRLLKKYGYLK